MTATSRSIQAAPSSRATGFAAFALVLAVALAVLALVAYGPLTTSQAGAAPAGVPAAVQHDHGWSSVSETGPSTWYVNPDSAAIDAARHPSRRSVTVTEDGVRITGAQGGALLYNGIPYTAPSDTDMSGGSSRLRLAQ